MTDPKITARSAKDKIFDAYQQMKAERDALQAGALDPKKMEAAQKDAARELSVQSIDDLGGFGESLKRFSAMTGSVLTTLQEGVIEREKELRLLDETIASRKDFVKELSGIEVEVNTLAALTQARAEMEDKWRLERDAAHRKHKAELAALNEEARKARGDFEDLEAEHQALVVKERERKASDWQYQFDRDCKVKRDAFNDELKTKGEQHNADIREALAKVHAREDELTKREDEMKAREDEVAELRDAFEKNKAARDTDINSAVAGAVAAEKAKRESAISAIVTAHTQKLEVEKERVELRDQTIAELKDQIRNLQSDLKDAQRQINDLAIKSLDSSHSVRAADAIRQMAEKTTVAATKANGKN
jgi:DNA repair exonuclease SbcCD ATPase subunit